MSKSKEEGAPIWAFYVGQRDQKKARKMREHLAKAAPATAGKAFRATPIKVMPKIPKNRMFAVDNRGIPELIINLKTGSVNFVDDLYQKLEAPHA